MCAAAPRRRLRVMATQLTPPAQIVAYIACDLTDGETLADYRKRVGTARRRWWHVAQR